MSESLGKTKRELRKSARKALLSNAIFFSLNVASKTALTIDLSVGGLSLTLPQALRIGQLCAISFDVPADNSKQRTLISGRVTSCLYKDDKSYRIGIQFTQADSVSIQLIKDAVEQYLEVAA